MANNEKIGEPETLQIDYPGLWPMIEPCRIEMTTSGAQDTIRSALRTGRFYEQEILEHVTRNAPRGGVYVDVGANIGTHAVWFGRWLASNICVVEKGCRVKYENWNLTETENNREFTPWSPSS